MDKITYKLKGFKCLTPCPNGIKLGDETVMVASNCCTSVCGYYKGKKEDKNYGVLKCSYKEANDDGSF